MADRWIDEYLVTSYVDDWLSTGNYYYERKKFGRSPPGKYRAWNKMVSALSDLERPDTQHRTARLIMGMHHTKWTYAIDPETGANEMVVGMCLLAQYLGGEGLPAKVRCAAGVHLMFTEEACVNPRYPYLSRIRCEGIVQEVRKLHAKLLQDPQTIPEPGDVRLGGYR